ncbi:DUF6387 family protein [Edwardsiella tarda]
MDLDKVVLSDENLLDMYEHITSEKFDVGKLLKIINVSKYDKVTKDFTLTDYYLAFSRRRELLGTINYIIEVESETYDEYVSLEAITPDSKVMTKSEYILSKEKELCHEKISLIYPLCKIISGNGATLDDNDGLNPMAVVKNVPITTIDANCIALENMNNGMFFGGMNDKKNNKLIYKAISGDATGDEISYLKKRRMGYGWPRGEPHENSRRVWAEIDINTPDDILISAFVSWLKDIRGNSLFINDGRGDFPIIKNIKASHISKWYSLRVLAYLDLKIIDGATKTKLTNKNIADIIYPEQFDIDTTEKVRKTLQPMVGEILQSDYINNILKVALSNM